MPESSEQTAAYEVGTLAGAGSFHCESCGFSVALRETDSLPPCPSCGGHMYRRTALFGQAPAAPPAPSEADPRPDWLDGARDALVTAGDYLAYEADGRVHVTPLQPGWTRIGRSLSAHVRLDDPTVSRRHALVFRDEDGAKVLDDRSLNGVFRNGERVELADLDDGDRIALGRFTLHVVVLAGDRESVRG